MCSKGGEEKNPGSISVVLFTVQTRRPLSMSVGSDLLLTTLRSVFSVPEHTRLIEESMKINGALGNLIWRRKDSVSRPPCLPTCVSKRVRIARSSGGACSEQNPRATVPDPPPAPLFPSVPPVAYFLPPRVSAFHEGVDQVQQSRSFLFNLRSVRSSSRWKSAFQEIRGWGLQISGIC